MKSSRLSRLSSVVVVLMLISVVVGACARPPEAGPSPAKSEISEFIVASITDLSGPAADVGKPTGDGMLDACVYTNERGGIAGVPLRVVMMDTRYDPAVAVSWYKKIISEKNLILIQFLQTAAIPLVAPLSVEDKKIIAQSAEPTGTFPPYNKYYFNAIEPLFGDQLRLQLRWWTDNVWKGPGKPKVALLVMDGAVGLSCGNIIVKAWQEVDKEWYDLVTLQWLSPAVVDISTQVLAAKQAKADVILLMHISQGGIALGKELETQNYHPAVLAYVSVMGTPLTKALKDKCVGWYTCVSNRMYEEVDVPIIKEFHDLRAKRYGSDYHKDPIGYMRGVYFQMTYNEVFQRCAAKFGVNNLTADNIKYIFENDMKSYDTKNIGAPVSYSAENHVGIMASKMYTYNTDLTLVGLTDWIEVLPWVTGQNTVEFHKSKPTL